VSQVSELEERSTPAEPAPASAEVRLPGRGDNNVAISCRAIPRFPGDLRPSKRPGVYILGKTQVNPGAHFGEPGTSNFFVAGEVVNYPRSPGDGAVCLAALAAAGLSTRGQRPEAFTWAVLPVKLTVYSPDGPYNPRACKSIARFRFVPQ